MTKKSYDASDIQTLEILEAIRHRPGMYLGGADDDAILVAVREVVDNSVDEHLNGHGSLIEITVDPDTGVIGVTDYARGIPVAEHPQHPGISTLEAAMTKAHTGGKFGTSYGISGGLHGTGLKAVTATSTHVRATVWREGQQHTLVFQDAKVVQTLTSEPMPKGMKASRTGTRVEFRLDPAIFKDAKSTVPDRDAMRRLLRERAYLCHNLRLTLKWGAEPTEDFFESEGIGAYVRTLAGGSILFKKTAHFENEDGADIGVEVALAWSSGFARDNVQGFCNIVRQSEGGTHVTGLRLALPGAIKSYIEQAGILSGKDKDLKIEGADCFEGVYAIVSIKHKSPVFKGQAKSALGNTDAQGAVQKAVNAYLPQWLEENPNEAKLIAKRVVSAAKARVAAQKAREQSRKADQGVFGMGSLGKLADCSSSDPSVTELMIVEGDSAGGSAKMGRDRVTQAVYSLKGKPLNSWELDAVTTLNNVELRDLSTAVIGTGLFRPEMTEEEVEAAMAKLRYSKIIILSDADIDGSHIQCLLLTHFFRHMRPLIERGHIFIGLPPLFRVTESGRHTYYKDEAALAEFFRARARRAVGDSPALLALASSSEAVTACIARSAGTLGCSPADLAYCMRALMTFDDSNEDQALAFAEAIEACRTEDGCEQVSGEEVDGGSFVVSGLDPETGRFFTMIVNDELMETVNSAFQTVSAIIGEENALELVSGPVSVGDRVFRDLHSAAVAAEALARKGIAIQRNKGLGEMQAEELGETTLDVSKRRLLRVDVSDFDAAGDVINDMMHKKTVDARKELVRSVQIAADAIDA